MNTSEILSCLQQDRKVAPYIAGVYPRDKLPAAETLPSALVANTDVNKGPGQHWVAMYLPSDEEPVYFDSYGLPPQQKEFSNYLGETFTYNDVQLQSPLSSACGQYSIFFVAMICRGCSMKQIQKLFDTKNLIENDTVVTEFVNRNYNLKTTVYDTEFLTKQICNIMESVMSK